MLLQGNDAHLASLVQAQGQGQGQTPSSSQTHGSSSLTYTGLDGKIGVDKIEHSEGRNGQGSGQGQGQGMHPGGQKDREVLLKPMSRASNQRNIQALVSTETTEKSDREFEQFTAKRARTTSTSRESLESNSGKDKWQCSAMHCSVPALPCSPPLCDTMRCGGDTAVSEQLRSERLLRSGTRKEGRGHSERGDGEFLLVLRGWHASGNSYTPILRRVNIKPFRSEAFIRNASKRIGSNSLTKSLARLTWCIRGMERVLEPERGGAGWVAHIRVQSTHREDLRLSII